MVFFVNFVRYKYMYSTFGKYIQLVQSGSKCEEFVHSNLVETYSTHLTRISLISSFKLFILLSMNKTHRYLPRVSAQYILHLLLFLCCTILQQEIDMGVLIYASEISLSALNGSKTFLHHTCAIYSELPSYISTMVHVKFFAVVYQTKYV